MIMKKLLIATWNLGKINMFKKMLWDIPEIDFLYLTDFDSIPSPIEDWKTVQENALLKAKYYFDAFWIPTLADDAGFEIDELDNQPWIMARRWAWELPDDVSDEDWLAYYLKKVEKISTDRFAWAFPFCRCLYKDENNVFYQHERSPIVLSKTPKRPYKAWRPTSSVVYLLDGRHEMSVPDNDPELQERFKKDWLIKLLQNL